MKNKIRYILIVGVVLTTGFGQAQSIKVQDTAFGRVLCNHFPLAMNASCDSIDTTAAQTNYGTPPLLLNASKEGVSSAGELIYFPGVDTIYLNKNNLTSFPSISHFPDLFWLNLAFNNLKEAPLINDDSISPNLNFLYLHKNDISSLSKWPANDSILEVIDLEYNDLSTLPPFEDYVHLRRLDLRYNHIRFDELVPIKQNPRWAVSQWQFFPQHPFKWVKDATREVGQHWNISVPQGAVASTYYLYRDSSLVDSSGDGSFVVQDIQKQDEGLYQVQVRNDSFPGSNAVLKSEPFQLWVSDPVSKKDVDIFSPNGDGVADFILLEGTGTFEIHDKSGRVIRSGRLPYSWYGRDQNGQKVSPGLYLIKKQGGYKKVLVSY